MQIAQGTDVHARKAALGILQNMATDESHPNRIDARTQLAKLGIAPGRTGPRKRMAPSISPDCCFQYGVKCLVDCESYWVEQLVHKNGNSPLVYLYGNSFKNLYDLILNYTLGSLNDSQRKN